jgi:hypothetical protein
VSGGSGGPIIIGTLTFSDPSRLSDRTVFRLRELAARVRDGYDLNHIQRLFVARAAFAYLGY